MKNENLKIKNPNEIVSVKFQFRIPNKNIPDNFHIEFSKIYNAEFEKRSLKPGFDAMAFGSTQAHSLKKQELAKLGITHQYFNPSRTYKMPRAEAELYTNQYFESYWDDRGNERMRLRIFNINEAELYVKQIPCAIIVEDQQKEKEKKPIKQLMAFQKPKVYNKGNTI